MNNRWRQIHKPKSPHSLKKYERIFYGYDYGGIEVGVIVTFGAKGDKIYILKIEELR